MLAIGILILSSMLIPCNTLLRAQQTNQTLTDLVEQRYPEAKSAEAEAYAEALRWLMDHPVNINSDPAYQLARVPGLNLRQARSITEWRRTHKWFESIDELEQVEGVGAGTVATLRHFATTGRSRHLRRALLTDPDYWMHEDEISFMTRFRRQYERRAGYRRSDGSGYRGNNIQYYQRLRYRSRHLDLNLTQQKDAGETWDWRSGGDHLAGYVSIHEVDRIKRLVVGNFDVTHGEGLLLGGGSLLGKGRNVLEAPLRGDSRLKPFGSSSETGFFRGIGLAVTAGKTRNIEITGWGSRRKLDATPLRGDTLRYSTESGYHRTLSERRRKDRLRRSTLGSTLQWRHTSGVLGGAAYYSDFSHPVARSASGDQTTALLHTPDYGGSIHHQSVLDRWLLAGELALNRTGDWGLVQGIHHSMSKYTGLAAAYRHYRPSYHSLFGSGFGESPGDAERGLYIGISHQITDRLQINGYFDQYQFHQPRYGDSRPSRGHDWLVALQFEQYWGWSGYLQLKADQKQEELDLMNPRGYPVRTKRFRPRHTLRVHLERRLTNSLRIRLRTEAARVDPTDSDVQYGFLIYQDVRWRPLDHLQFDLRLSLFQTDDYDSRVYQFENDLLYVMSNKMLHGTGRRSYLLINFEPFEWLEGWIKYGATRYSYQSKIGSGLGQIDGPRQSKLGIQLRVKW